MAIRAEKSNVAMAIERLTVFDLWAEAPFPQGRPVRDGVYLSPFKQSVRNTPSFSISKGGKRWKDFSDNRPARGVLAFCERCHPDWEKRTVYKHLVERAGLEWHESFGGGRTMVHSFKERREYRLQKQRSEAEARDLALARDDKAIEFPGRGKEVARAPKFVRERWAAGRSYFHDTKAVERLAGNNPSVWLICDNDQAGDKWRLEHTDQAGRPRPSFAQSIRDLGVDRVHASFFGAYNDFNDAWRANPAAFGPSQLYEYMDHHQIL